MVRDGPPVSAMVNVKAARACVGDPRTAAPNRTATRGRNIRKGIIGIVSPEKKLVLDFAGLATIAGPAGLAGLLHPRTQLQRGGRNSREAKGGGSNRSWARSRCLPGSRPKNAV